jgi:hypothetical protein
MIMQSPTKITSLNSTLQSTDAKSQALSETNATSAEAGADNLVTLEDFERLTMARLYALAESA